jgi:hypothetical protein
LRVKKWNYCNRVINRVQKEYSFDFLVNSRIISELGFQSSFIEEDKESIELENKYKFNVSDSKKIIN